MILGHIGVRKGSKGVPDKNFRQIAGKALIDWSLEQLLRNPRIDKLVVSSDDANIYEHCLRRGGLDIGLRPDELATDTAPKWRVWQDSLVKAQAKLHAPIRAFIDLDCTSPLRDDADIDNALNLFLKEQPDMVMSCCIARKNPYFNLVEPDENGALQLCKPLPQTVATRQQAPLVYEHAASIYVIAPSYLHSGDSLYAGKTIPYVMPAARCWDIDTEFDFKIVEHLMREKH